MAVIIPKLPPLPVSNETAYPISKTNYNPLAERLIYPEDNNFNGAIKVSALFGPNKIRMPPPPNIPEYIPLSDISNNLLSGIDNPPENYQINQERPSSPTIPLLNIGNEGRLLPTIPTPYEEVILYDNSPQIRTFKVVLPNNLPNTVEKTVPSIKDRNPPGASVSYVPIIPISADTNVKVVNSEYPGATASNFPGLNPPLPNEYKNNPLIYSSTQYNYY